MKLGFRRASVQLPQRKPFCRSFRVLPRAQVCASHVRPRIRFPTYLKPPPDSESEHIHKGTGCIGSINSKNSFRNDASSCATSFDSRWVTQVNSPLHKAELSVGRAPLTSMTTDNPVTTLNCEKCGFFFQSNEERQ